MVSDFVKRWCFSLVPASMRFIGNFGLSLPYELSRRQAKSLYYLIPFFRMKSSTVRYGADGHVRSRFPLDYDKLKLNC